MTITLPSVVNSRLLPHQKKVARFMKDHDKLLLYHSLGSGKTFTALAAARYNSHLKLVVIAYPQLVIKNFLNEYQQFKCLFPHTTPPINHCMLMTLLNYGAEYAQNYLRNSFIIIDESHTVRNKETSRLYNMLYQVLNRLWEEGSIKLLLLTGTPIIDSVDDFFEAMKLMGVEDGQEASYVSFLKRDACPIDYQGEQIPELDWNIKTLELPASHHEEYVSITSTDRESFYIKAINCVLDSKVKQDYAITTIAKAIKQDTQSKFFIYCNRLGPTGTDHIAKEVLRRIGIKPCVVTSKQKSITIQDINNSRIIVGSLASNEGISIENLRQVHVITPHWNISQIRQAIGRGTRFKVNHQVRPLEVFCYAVYYQAKEPHPKYSIDLYKYHKSFVKERQSRELLGKFADLVPRSTKQQLEQLEQHPEAIDLLLAAPPIVVTTAPEGGEGEEEESEEPDTVDLLEDLMYHHRVDVTGQAEKRIASLLDICCYKGINVDRKDSLVRLVSLETEIPLNVPKLELSVRQGRERVFQQIRNMNFEELLEALETSIISRNFEVSVFFDNNIVLLRGNIYHTLMYRKPITRSYSHTYFITEGRGLTKKLIQLASGNFEWVLCSVEEEKEVIGIARARFQDQVHGSVDMFFSLPEKKFKIRTASKKIWDRRLASRGKDIRSFTTSELRLILQISQEMLGYTMDESIPTTCKFELMNIIIWMFFDSNHLKYF
ncbi:hypothetical protein GGF37_000819 [Kickxella alabastrina]|nr:hypothetical protein GGF37_000819 [Kickxella alabastrina]